LSQATRKTKPSNYARLITGETFNFSIDLKWTPLSDEDFKKMVNGADPDFNPANFLKKDMIVTRPIMSPVFDGGDRPPEHREAQNRLELIFIRRNFITKQEDPLWCFNEIGELKQYQTDVMIMTLKSYNLVAIEIDNYGPNPVNKKMKAKSPRVMNQRDQLISLRYKIPVVRFDIDCLKVGRKKTSVYMTDQEIFDHVMAFCVKYYKDNAIRVENNNLINLA
jgi:hypothetical protein